MVEWPSFGSKRIYRFASLLPEFRQERIIQYGVVGDVIDFLCIERTSQTIPLDGCANAQRNMLLKISENWLEIAVVPNRDSSGNFKKNLEIRSDTDAGVLRRYGPANLC